MRVLLTLVLAGLILAALAPLAAGNHCESRLSVYSRPSFAPAPAPPYTHLDRNACFVLKARGIEDHSLAPNADQIMVRVNGVFGASVTELRVDLDGMGFEAATFTLRRTTDPGGETYQLPEWIFLPDPAGGSLTATVFYPGEPYAVTYEASSVQLPLPPPAAPTSA